MLPFNPWRVAVVGLCGVVVILFLQVWSKDVDYQTAKVLVQNPKRQERVRVVRVEGPVRIRVETIEKGEERRTIREEVRGEVREEKASETISEPVSLASVTGGQQIRFPLGLYGNAPFSRPQERPKNYGVTGGIRLERLVVLGSYGYNSLERTESRISILWEF